MAKSQEPFAICFLIALSLGLLGGSILTPILVYVLYVRCKAIAMSLVVVGAVAMSFASSKLT